jgi:hypothetical protein
MALVLRPPTEREPLPSKLREIGRARKRIAVLSGAFLFVATVLGLTALAGFVDAAVHLGALPRALALGGILALGGVVWVRCVTRPMKLPTDPLALALELENRFPNLNDALATAVEFLGPDEGEEDAPPKAPPGVSNRMLANAVRSAERKAGRLPLDELVPTGACWRNAWLCALVVAVAVPLALWNTNRAATAAARLGDPFGAHPWPTKTRIEFLNPKQFPARVGRGEPFELKFAARGIVLGSAVVKVRVEGGGEFEEQFPLALDNDPAVPRAAVVTAKFEPARVANSFAVRVTANDYDSDWLDVTVVPPPRLVPLDGRPSPQFRAAPPAYTRLPAQQLPDGAAVIEVPLGTRLTFGAATDTPVASAVLSFTGDKGAVAHGAPVAFAGHLNPLLAVSAQALAHEIGADVPVRVSGEGTRLTAEFVPSLSGTYALRLTDATGLVGTRLIEIRLTPDPVPVVALARPLPGFDPPLLAPNANVLVAATAEDKVYGLRDFALEYRVGREGALRTVRLARAANVHPNAVAALTGRAAVFGLHDPESATATRALPVAGFVRDDGTPVREGDTLFLRAAADDWDDVSLKGPGRSAPEVEIRIASAEAIDAWIQHELAGLRPELVRLRDQQRDARAKLTDVAPQKDGSLSAGDRDRLLAAEQLQRQLRAKVTDPRDGLRARADLLRATARANALPRSGATDRAEVVALELGRMAERDLGTADQHVADARQFAAAPKPESVPAFNEAVRKGARHQKNVEDTATALLDLLAQWGGTGEIRGEARVLRDAILRQIAANEQLKARVPEGKVNPSPEQQKELDHAAGKVEPTAAETAQLVARAARLAGERDEHAAGLRARADAADQEATDLKLKALDEPNPVDKSKLNAKADELTAAAKDLRAQAAAAANEAEALRKGLNAAGGDALPDDLRRANDLLRANQQGRAADVQRAAADGLNKLAAALAEKENEDVPELAKQKQLRAAADALDALAGVQDELRKKVAAANRIADPVKRQEALKELAKEQDKLIERGRDILQKLQRDRADDAAREARAALDRMEAARDDLEQGRANDRAQAEAVDRLDAARDQLDRQAAQAGRQLADEKRRKLADIVKALLERQRGAVQEASRLHAEAAKNKGWDRALLTSYSDLEAVRVKEIALELRKLSDTEFAPLPVFARMLKDAADADDRAREKIKARCDDADLAAAFDADLETANDRKVNRPLELAQRRLEQLADALKPDEPKKPKEGAPKQPNDQQPPPPNPEGGGNGDAVPPLAQLKVLRALQAELNERTAQFAKDHPEAGKLNAEEKTELTDLERAQRDIAALFELMAQKVQKKPNPDKEAPAPEKP